MAESKKKKQQKYIYALGRRKTATATVRLFEGKGENILNKSNKVEDVYTTPRERSMIQTPFEVTDTQGNFHFHVVTNGGGRSSQLGAIRLALARALVKFDDTYRKPLKKKGLLTRDARQKERKKPGLKKARKKEQYSKR